MDDCIFCKIIAGTIPAAKVLDEPGAVAFLDIKPVKPGHTLLITRNHVDNLTVATADDLRGLAEALPRLSKAIQVATDSDGLNVGINSGASAGQIVPHLHLHLIPRKSSDTMRTWDHSEYAPGEAEEVADKIKQALL
jgi:histidine triad (HIT) family protein